MSHTADGSGKGLRENHGTHDRVHDIARSHAESPFGGSGSEVYCNRLHQCIASNNTLSVWRMPCHVHLVQKDSRLGPWWGGPSGHPKALRRKLCAPTHTCGSGPHCAAGQPGWSYPRNEHEVKKAHQHRECNCPQRASRVQSYKTNENVVSAEMPL